MLHFQGWLIQDSRHWTLRYFLFVCLCHLQLAGFGFQACPYEVSGRDSLHSGSMAPLVITDTISFKSKETWHGNRREPREWKKLAGRKWGGRKKGEFEQIWSAYMTYFLDILYETRHYTRWLYHYVQWLYTNKNGGRLEGVSVGKSTWYANIKTGVQIPSPCMKSWE